MKNHKHRVQKGFTIVELLIVIVVIAILASITIVSYNGIRGRSNDTVVQQDLANLAKKFALYQIDKGNYPLTVTDLLDVDASVNKGSYLVSPSTTYNVVPCITSGGIDYSVAAISITGNRYYVGSKSGGVKQFTGASVWTDVTGYSTACSETLAGSSLPTGSGAPGYGGAWRPWLD